MAQLGRMKRFGLGGLEKEVGLEIGRQYLMMPGRQRVGG